MPPKEHRPTLWVDDFLFLEAPKWQRDRLWVSDVFDKKLYTIDADGRRTARHDVPGRPAGIGFMPDGRTVVVSMRDRTLMTTSHAGLTLLADLSGIAAGDLNDLVIDELGRIYIGNFGYDFHGGAPKQLTDLHVIEPDGTIRVAASGLEFPNGAVLIDNGRTLVVAETWACRLTAFDRAADGTLSNARLFANLGQREPDGLCADAANGVWAACFNTGEFVRVMDGGEITDAFRCGEHAISCDLGGSDGKTLFCSAYAGSFADMDAGKRLGALFTLRVETPGISFRPR